ncbi:TM0106 family RecB-like putative nuclease [Curtobacterium sp. MCPF17_052]|uniref:TM0106 family RecB-like putative nuclease n=1 Tax=Curtobacterium sp. MCPF17_052 TaxID=2175655 RepID=UPI0034638ED7
MSGRSSAASTPSSAAANPCPTSTTTCSTGQPAWGDQHELDYLEILKETHDVVEFDRPAPPQYREAAAAALQVMRDGADVLYQPTFHAPASADGTGFIGFADFIIRNDRGEYEVYDTKLARHAKISALLQLAAYAEQMRAHGIPTGQQVHLVLGDRTTTTHELADIVPVYRTQRAELIRVIAERLAADEPMQWGDPRYSSCGRCSACQQEVQRHRDLVLVAGMRLDQRTKLIRQGVRSIDDLAVRTAPVSTMSKTTLDRLVRQASLQIETERAAGQAGRAGPAFDVLDPRALDAIPAPDPGDVFFDFEGDPLHTEDGVHWGLDYLFGLVDDQAEFRAFWAHTVRDERQALVDFLAYIAERRERYPDMHIYHYAAYERTHLLSLAARHGVGGGRGRRPAARRCPRRPVPDRAEGAGRRQPQLLDQEARAAVHGRRLAAQRRDERGRQHHRLRRRDHRTPHRRSRRGPAAARPGRRLQRLRLPVDAAPPRLAAGPPCRARARRHDDHDRAGGPPAHPRRARAEPGVRRAGRRDGGRRRPRPHARPDRARARRGRDRLPPPRGEDVLAGPLRPAAEPGRRVGRHPRRARRRTRLRRA